MVDTPFKQIADFKAKDANLGAKSRDHHRYSTPAPLRRKGLAKQLPVAIHQLEVRTNYPMEVEELCQVLESMLKRRLAEDQVIDAEELVVAA